MDDIMLLRIYHLHSFPIIYNQFRKEKDTEIHLKFSVPKIGRK